MIHIPLTKIIIKMIIQCILLIPRFKSTGFKSLKYQKCILPNVKVNIVFGFVCYIWSEISADKTMPVPIIFSI